MKKLILLSLAGITSIALTHAGWAAGHGGGGGGFHGGGGGFGGGHGGGGFHGGGLSGGRGFGGLRSSSFSSLGMRPSYRQPVYNGPVSRSRTSSVRSTSAFNQQQNRFASPSNRAGQVSRPANRSVTPSNRAATVPQKGLNARTAHIYQNQAPSSQPDWARRSANPSARATTVPQTGLNGRTDHIYERQADTSHPDWDRRRAHYENNHWWAYNGDNWIGLDTGFLPWDYYPYYTYDYYPYDYFIGDSADVPPAYQGTTTTAPAPDPTVTAVQTQLSQQGYYGGPVDGLFGPTTRDAVARYQAEQNLTVTGSLTPDTLQALGLSQVATS